MNRALGIAGLLLLILLGAWVSPGWTQGNIRFEQFSPQEERHWKEVLRRNPGDSRANFQLGRHYEFARRIRDAAKFYQQATLLDPGWAQAFFSLGKAYREMGRYQEAAMALERAVLLKSNYARAYHFLGLVKIRLGNYEDAANAFIKAYTYDPGWAETYHDNTTYGMHSELGDKAIMLRIIKHVYPVNQQLARLLYNRWARNNAGMKEYWETVAGRDLPPDKGYQNPPIVGYQEQQELGFQRPAEVGFQRKINQPSAPVDLAD